MSIQTVTVTVPAQGLGPVADISAIVGQKTVQLSGIFDGYYNLLGTQDDIKYVAITTFDAGGPEGIKVTIDGAIKSVRLQAVVRSTTGVSCTVSGTQGVGQNGFGTIATLAPGATGLTASVDTSTFIPPNGSEADTCLLCSGSFEGVITVLGSSDNVAFNPVGEFRVARRPEGSPPDIALAPLQVGAKVRYVRLRVDAVVTDTTVVTLGGRVPVTGGSSGTPTQIFVSDGSGVTSLQVLGQASANPLGATSISAGFGCNAPGTQSLAAGVGSSANAANSFVIGVGCVSGGAQTVVFGTGCSCSGGQSLVGGVGSNINGGSNNLNFGNGSQLLNNSNNVVSLGNGNVIGPSATVSNTVVAGFNTQIQGSGSVGLGQNVQLLSDNSIVIGTSGQLDATSAQSAIVGYSCHISSGSSQSLVMGYLSAIAVNSPVSVAVGPQNVVTATAGLAMGYGNTIGSPNSLGIGRQCTVSSAGGYCTALGQNITINGSDHIIAIGQNLTAGQVGLVDVIMLGRDLTSSANSINIGKTNTVVVAASSSVSVGFAIDQQGSGSTAVGQTISSLAVVSVLLGNNLHNTATSDNSILVGKDNDSRGPGCIAIGSNINIGLAGECTDCVALGPGTYIGGNSVPIDYATALGGGARAQSNHSIALGKNAKVDYNCDDSQAYGMRATTTMAGEVIFASPTNPVNYFHCVGTAALDLFRFDLAAAAAAGDSAMYLLYKNSVGTLVLNPVKVEAVTGYLKVTP